MPTVASRIVLATVLLVALSPHVLAQRPPTELKKVGDHWTAWDPPTTFPEGADVYIIVAGDTLWDLAEKFYGNPYLWPQIWERNQYILDAHWIYPGDPLVLGMEVEPGDVLGEEGEEGRDQVAEEPPGRQNPFVQLGTPDDIYCSGYIGPLNEDFGYYITGSEFEALAPSLQVTQRGKIVARWGVVDAVKVGLYLGDIVYVSGGRAAGLSPGDVFTAIQPEETVRHPRRGRVVGRYYSYMGRVKILSVQDESAIAEVVQNCDPIPVGTALKPFVPEPVPSERRSPLRPVNDPPPESALVNAATLLRSRDRIVTLGQDHVVFIDRGEVDDVIPGDVYTIYRFGRRGRPPVVLGELAVLSVHRETSLAKVIESRYPIYIGDIAELK